MSGEQGPKLKKEIAAALEEFDRNPQDRSIQEKVLGLVAQTPDATEIIRKIMGGCTSKLAQGEEPGAFVAISATSTPFGHVETPIRYLRESLDEMSKVHSEHLYFAAKCLGRSQMVSPEMIEEVIRRLLFEFDLEISPPRAAIQAFGEIGEKALPSLMVYIQDCSKETFSREDAALALGAIGTDLVVSTLSKWLCEATYADKAMPLYALGKTRNPKAKPVITNFLKRYPNHPSVWVANNALADIG